jgi:hypothetical protein
MTWITARRRLVTMIEDIPESAITSPKVFGPRFIHEPSLFVTSTIGRARRFALRGVRADTLPQATGTDSRFSRMDIDLIVDYPMLIQDDVLDEIIWTDYACLRDNALLDVSTWGRPSSTIITLVTDGEVAIDADTDDILGDDGRVAGRRLTMRFPCLHQGS